MNDRMTKADPAVRLSLYLSLPFLASGAAMPFLPRFLEIDRGLSGLEIGAVLSAASLVRLFVAPLISAWADGFTDRSTPLRLLPVGVAIAFLAFAGVHGFWALFAVGFIASTLAAAITPIAEGALLRASAASRLPYGIGRAVASAAFIVGNLAGGALVAVSGAQVVIIWIAASYGLAALSGFALARDPAPASARAASYRARLSQVGGLLRNPRYLTVIVGCGFIQAGHAFYYGFSTLIWEKQGLATSFVGVLWALGVLVEIGFLAALPLIERRARPEALVIAGAAAGVARWTILALTPPAWLLVPLQALHALTFAAAHVGALRLVQRETPEAAAASGQMLYAALASGTLMGAASIGAGWLYDEFVAHGYWAMTALAALGGALILNMMRQSKMN
jgi:PPP family 3-phenylpropionic acid transporter